MQRVVAYLIVIIFIMSVIFWVSSRPASGAAVAADCRACHIEEVDSAQSRLFVHAPFRDGDCAVCHVQEQIQNLKSAISGAAKAETSALEPAQIRAVDVHWIRECYEPARDLILTVDSAEIQSMLVVEIWDQCRSEHQYVMSVPPLGQLEAISSRGASPFVLHKMSLQRDPRDSDTLVVQCTGSVPLRGQIYLQRTDIPDRVVEVGPVYQTEIKVRIPGLKHDVGYSLYLEAEDASGRQQRSLVHEFVLEQLSARSKTALSVVIPSSGDCDLETSMALYRGSCAGLPCYLLAIEANEPVTLSVGTLKGVASSLTPLYGTEEQQEGESAIFGRFDHPSMAEPRFTNYSACRACHPGSFGPMSHPVDIVPSSGMKVSAELPLMSDGRISCMTCHEIHAGDEHYRLRFESKRKLCNGCHEHY
ncbi:MAG: cytochrome c3 family protein [Desulfuromonadaceae bacterium]|nr:cytochrome c3 family protein [Desulfuromonadaceae bacterium]